MITLSDITRSSGDREAVQSCPIVKWDGRKSGCTNGGSYDARSPDRAARFAASGQPRTAPTAIVTRDAGNRDADRGDPGLGWSSTNGRRHDERHSEPPSSSRRPQPSRLIIASAVTRRFRMSVSSPTLIGRPRPAKETADFARSPPVHAATPPRCPESRLRSRIRHCLSFLDCLRTVSLPGQLNHR